MRQKLAQRDAIFARRSRGTSFAPKPASTSAEASDGSISAAGSSSRGLPCSTSCRAATDVKSFTIEANGRSYRSTRALHLPCYGAKRVFIEHPPLVRGHGNNTG